MAEVEAMNQADMLSGMKRGENDEQQRAADPVYREMLHYKELYMKELAEKEDLQEQHMDVGSSVQNMMDEMAQMQQEQHALAIAINEMENHQHRVKQFNRSRSV